MQLSRRPAHPDSADHTHAPQLPCPGRTKVEEQAQGQWAGTLAVMSSGNIRDSELGAFLKARRAELSRPKWGCLTRSGVQGQRFVPRGGGVAGVGRSRLLHAPGTGPRPGGPNGYWAPLRVSCGSRTPSAPACSHSPVGLPPGRVGAPHRAGSAVLAAPTGRPVHRTGRHCGPAHGHPRLRCHGGRPVHRFARVPEKYRNFVRLIFREPAVRAL